MNRQQMLQEIYEKIADKTLSFGCIYEFGGDKFPICIHSIKALKNNVGTYKVIGHPISLAGVLSALGKMGMFSYTPGHIEQYHVDGKWQTICLRKLLNEDGSDAYLEDQSDDTIEALHKLLVRK